MKDLLNSEEMNTMFYLTVNIFNLELKLNRKLSTQHPYYKRKIEMITALSNKGLNSSDFIALDKRASEYIIRHS
tara:strand:+ start:563 stop:784 length:222 start_codon:yes stop_codon:yes gene_type:complete